MASTARRSDWRLPVRRASLRPTRSTRTAQRLPGKLPANSSPGTGHAGDAPRFPDRPEVAPEPDVDEVTIAVGGRCRFRRCPQAAARRAATHSRSQPAGPHVLAVSRPCRVMRRTPQAQRGSAGVQPEEERWFFLPRPTLTCCLFHPAAGSGFVGRRE